MNKKQANEAFEVVTDGWGDRQLIDAEIELFTGLTDKNGVEIYEGDVVIVDTNSTDRENVIVWQDFRASWAAELSPCANQDLYKYVQYGNKVEVIGNIHEDDE